MGKIELTADLLDAKGVEINLGLLGLVNGYDAEHAINYEFDNLADWVAEVTGIDPETWANKVHGKAFDELVEYDLDGIFRYVANLIPDFLTTEVPDIFGDDAPVQIGRFAGGKWSRDYMSQPYDSYIYVCDIDGARLLELYADRIGQTTVSDGRDISGFIRTCDNAYWCQIEVLRALVSNELTYRENDAVNWLMEDIPDYVTLTVDPYIPVN